MNNDKPFNEAARAKRRQRIEEQKRTGSACMFRFDMERFILFCLFLIIQLAAEVTVQHLQPG